MTRLPLWAFLAFLMVLAACMGQSPAPEVTSSPVPATSDPVPTTPTPTDPTPTPRPTPVSVTATATPSPASSTGTSTPIPTREPALPSATPETRPKTVLSITVSAVPADIPEYNRMEWRHWNDEDGDCQDARQEVLVSESLVEVTFESDRNCRVATGRWYGAFAGAYVETPGDMDVDHLVPLKNAHDSGGWAWSSARKEDYANHLGDPDHLIAVTSAANRSKGAKGPEEWRPSDEGYWCQYATDWTEVKFEWGLTMTQGEAEAVIAMLDTCEESVEVEAGRAEGVPTPQPEPEGDGEVYESCEEAEAAGESRVQGSAGGGKGFPKEMVPSARDGDGDGVVCER